MYLSADSPVTRPTDLESYHVMLVGGGVEARARRIKGSVHQGDLGGRVRLDMSRVVLAHH